MQNRTPSVEDIQQRAIGLIKSGILNNAEMAYKTAINHFNNFRAGYNFPLVWPIPIN